MNYGEVLTMAGANVLAYEEFGSYQGDWYALVEFDGVRGFVTGCYGSCSGCDTLGNIDMDHWHNDTEDGPEESCKECKQKLDQYKRTGLDYLETIITKEEALKKASESLEWDMEAQEMVDWIKSK